MNRCYARTCGTCWACKDAAEQLRAVQERDRVAQDVQLPDEPIDELAARRHRHLRERIEREAADLVAAALIELEPNE